jgi:glucosamine--fructose-6-phosphate aminotransferase (isomerizing)
MTPAVKEPGALMAAEVAEAPAAFARAAAADHGPAVASLEPGAWRALYTIARGSSDAAANVLSYEAMRETGLPVTSLPPSVFSVGRGVGLADTAALVISQSGASDDLVRSARGAAGQGARVLAITNVPASPVEGAAHLTLPIAAGPERAVPATKTVVGAIAAGMSLIAALAPDYAPRARADAAALVALAPIRHPREAAITSALLRASHVYVIGRDTGYGAAQEIALKLKETCALHAEAYSSSEVLHGPLQLVTRPLLILILDTGQPQVQDSLDTAEARFRQAGGEVIRIRPSDINAPPMTPAGAAALLLCLLYPVVLATAVALGHDPDAPATLSKVTQTT